MKSSLQACRMGIWTAACVAFTLVGCGGRDYDLGDVSGTVKLDGMPLSNASVTFVPIGSGAGPASVAITDEAGHYQLQTIDLDLPGAVLGTHRVSLSTARADGADERATISKERVPPKFRDGSFHIKVTGEGTDAANIDMKTRKKRKRRRR